MSQQQIIRAKILKLYSETCVNCLPTGKMFIDHLKMWTIYTGDNLFVTKKAIYLT